MRAIVAAVLSLSVSACVLASPASDPAPQNRPLTAHFVPEGSSGVAFSVNRPAHVAVFEITPGAGTSLIYPGMGMGPWDGTTYGYRSLRAVRRGNQAHYLPAAGPAYGPRFYFLIASERPLDLERFGSYGYGLRGALGARFASLNAYSVMEDLARLALPSLEDDGSWTTDMYVVWPQVLFDQPGPQRVLLQCNGYAMFVPLELAFQAQRVLCSPEERRQPQDSTAVEDDSTRVTEPSRRPPLPRTEESALRRRIIASSQLDAPDTEGWRSRRPVARDRFIEDDERRLHPRMRGDEPRPRVERVAEGERGVPVRPAGEAEAPRLQPRGADEASRPAAPRPAEAAPRPAPAPPPPPPSPSGSERPVAPPKGGETGCNPCQPH